jgi:hypothetical protein
VNCKRKIVAFVGAFCCCLTVAFCYGQEKSINTFYADFASKGALYSVNYDRVFGQGENLSKTYRVGVSFLKDVIAVPLGINFFTGHQSSHVEFSLTVVPYIEHYSNLFSGDNLSDKKLYIIPGAGYRYQPVAGGFFFKAIAAPIIYLDPPSDNFWKMSTKIYPGITAGLGYSF